MKEFAFKPRSKYYEFNENVSYKRKNVDFNEYGLNKYDSNMEKPLEFNIRTNKNCVKRVIKR